VRFSYTLPRRVVADDLSRCNTLSSAGSGSVDGEDATTTLPLQPLPPLPPPPPPGSPPPEVHSLWHYRACPRADGSVNEDGERLWHAARMDADAADVAAAAAAAKFVSSKGRSSGGGGGGGNVRAPRPRKAGVGDVSSIS
jgi:hypothetical protein